MFSVVSVLIILPPPRGDARLSQNDGRETNLVLECCDVRMRIAEFKGSVEDWSDGAVEQRKDEHRTSNK